MSVQSIKLIVDYADNAAPISDEHGDTPDIVKYEIGSFFSIQFYL